MTGKHKKKKAQHFEQREILISNNIKIENIKGLYRHENHSLIQAVDEYEKSDRPKEIFFDASTFCNVHAYINCPLNLSFLYIANVFSTEEWSFGLRNLQRMPKERFCGVELSANNTKVYLDWQVCEESRSIENSSAWDQNSSLWMKSYFRVADALPNLKRKGTLLMHVTSYHSYYDKNAHYLPLHIQKTQRRQGRDWIGDKWELNCKRQLLEMHNIKTILEKRFKDSQY